MNTQPKKKFSQTLGEDLGGDSAPSNVADAIAKTGLQGSKKKKDTGDQAVIK